MQLLVSTNRYPRQFQIPWRHLCTIFKGFFILFILLPYLVFVKKMNVYILCFFCTCILWFELSFFAFFHYHPTCFCLTWSKYSFFLNHRQENRLIFGGQKLFSKYTPTF